MTSRSARTHLLQIAALAAAIACADANAATLYRWNDANGRPVVSDRPPPPGTPYTTLDGRRYGTGGSVRRSPSEQPAGSTPMSADAESASTSERPPRTAAVVEKSPDLCQQATDNIATLETFARIRTTDPDGTVRFLTREEIEGQLAVAKSVAEVNC